MLPPHVKDVPLVRPEAVSFILPEHLQQWRRAWSLTEDVDAARVVQPQSQAATLLSQDIQICSRLITPDRCAQEKDDQHSLLHSL